MWAIVTNRAVMWSWRSVPAADFEPTPAPACPSLPGLESQPASRAAHRCHGLVICMPGTPFCLVPGHPTPWMQGAYTGAGARGGVSVIDLDQMVAKAKMVDPLRPKPRPPAGPPRSGHERESQSNERDRPLLAPATEGLAGAFAGAAGLACRHGLGLAPPSASIEHARAAAFRPWAS